MKIYYYVFIYLPDEDVNDIQYASMFIKNIHSYIKKNVAFLVLCCNHHIIATKGSETFLWDYV